MSGHRQIKAACAVVISRKYLGLLTGMCPRSLWLFCSGQLRLVIRYRSTVLGSYSLFKYTSHNSRATENQPNQISIAVEERQLTNLPSFYRCSISNDLGKHYGATLVSLSLRSSISAPWLKIGLQRVISFSTLLSPLQRA